MNDFFIFSHLVTDDARCWTERFVVSACSIDRPLSLSFVTTTARLNFHYFSLSLSRSLSPLSNSPSTPFHLFSSVTISRAFSSFVTLTHLDHFPSLAPPPNLPYQPRPEDERKKKDLVVHRCSSRACINKREARLALARIKKESQQQNQGEHPDKVKPSRGWPAAAETNVVTGLCSSHVLLLLTHCKMQLPAPRILLQLCSLVRARHLHTNLFFISIFVHGYRWSHSACCGTASTTLLCSLQSEPETLLRFKKKPCHESRIRIATSYILL